MEERIIYICPMLLTLILSALHVQVMAECIGFRKQKEGSVSVGNQLTETKTGSGEQLNLKQNTAVKNTSSVTYAVNPTLVDQSTGTEDGVSGNPYAAVEAAIRETSENKTQVSCVMICGNISLLPASAIKKTAETYRLVIAGDVHKPALRPRMVHYYDTRPTDEKFQKLFDAFDIDVVWYLSGYADGQDGMDNEYKCLLCILDACVKNCVSKLIVVGTMESMNYKKNYDVLGHSSGCSYAPGNGFGAGQMERFIGDYARDYGLKTIVLRAPYIASWANDAGFLGQVFSRLYQGEKLVFPYSPAHPVDFLSGNDLVELMVDISEECGDETAVYSVSSGYPHTWGDLEKELRRLAPETVVVYEENPHFIPDQSGSLELKQKYGFVPADNVLISLEDAFLAYKSHIRKKSRGRAMIRKAGAVLSTHLLGYIELIVFFLLGEFLVSKTGSWVYFKYVDIRLCYVLIMGTVYGTGMGILAGILAGIALFFGYQKIGVNGTMLFYNIENWLPFVLYMITGSITGYVSVLRRQKNGFLQKENDLLREKYLFLNQVYLGAIENKREYKRQILGYKDSFGVMLQAVTRLDSVLPQEIFRNGIEIMEGILNNHSIAIYTVDSGQRFCRLSASSREFLNRLPKSLELQSLAPVFKTVQKGDVWKNSGLLDAMPMYAYGVCDEGKVSLMIFLYDVGPDQMSLYYLNLFSILCKLIKLSYIRALEYQRAIQQEKYYPDTLVVMPDYFKELLKAQKELTEAGMASHAVIRFESRDKVFLSDSLKGLIRNSDILGADEKGTLYLLLTQFSPQVMETVLERLEQGGLKFEFVSGN